jgi:tetratricopeptide (TPR) repeat protein
MPCGVMQSQLDQAIALHQQGRLAEAAQLYARVLAGEPSSFVPRHLLGVVRYQQGRDAEALELIGAALEINPQIASAWANHGLVLTRLGRFEEALASCDEALAKDRGHADAWNNRGIALAGLKRFGEAIASHDQALGIRRDHAEAWNNRGVALWNLGRLREALASYDRALAVKPDHVEGWNNRAAVLRDLARFEDAVTSADKALSLRSDFAQAWNNRGAALQELEQPAEALASYDKALAIKPDYADAWNNRGVVLWEAGRLDEAREAYVRALTLDPKLANACLNYADTVTFAAGDPYLKAMEALRDSPLSDADRLQLDFALGKAYADLKLYPRSFERLLRGNALKRTQIPYNEAATLGLFDRIEAAFTAELLREKEKWNAGSPSPVPVFIIGMPRSGSSLVEQILASHPQVHGAGELKTFNDTAKEAGGGTPYPEFVSNLDANALGRLGARYLETVQMLVPGAGRIADKMPANYLFAGLIHLAFPNARIIHTLRDPVDTCLSCFSKLFAGGRHNYTYDLAELGRYHRRYQQMMAHWQRVLPPGRILDVRYEDIVADLDGQARRLVAHCGLDWDARCLSFYDTKRPVRTASALQVRQPIYRGAMGRAAAYGEFLGPLTDALNGG